MNQLLFSIEESLQEIDHFISELQMYIYVAMKNCEDSADNLTQNESTAIQIYTMDWDPIESCLSRLLNKDFRLGSRNVLKKWFLHALNKLPSYKGTV